jgi:hypothetical protein
MVRVSGWRVRVAGLALSCLCGQMLAAVPLARRHGLRKPCIEQGDGHGGSTCRQVLLGGPGQATLACGMWVVECRCC